MNNPNVIDLYWSIKQFDWLIMDWLIEQSYCWCDRFCIYWLNNWFLVRWLIYWFIEQRCICSPIEWYVIFLKCMFNFNKHAMTKNASWCTAVSFISNNLGFIRIFYNNVFLVKIHGAIKQNAGHIIRCLCGIVSFLYIWLSSYVKGN